jgi:ABC-type polysaccharide/polyol phosphate transport system ATPase subunit
MLINLKNVSLEFNKNDITSNSLKDLFVGIFKSNINNVKKKSILYNINLTINQGDRLAILGKNGAGKSSLLRLISGIYYPTVGSISTNCSIAALIEIGSGFNPEYTGRQNIILNSLFFGLSFEDVMINIDKIIHYSELGESIDAPVKYYSTGMLLRLSFATAINIDRDLLILDEMFAGGDLNFKKKATITLENKISRSKALIFTSHDQNIIDKYANRAIVVDKNSIIFDGKPNNAKLIYRDLVIQQ